MKSGRLRASTKTHARIHAFPFAGYFQHGRLDGLRLEKHGTGKDLVIDLGELRLSTPPVLIEHQGRPAERLQAEYHPKRLRFSNLSWIRQEGLYERLETVPVNHPCRSLQGMLVWSPAAKEPLFLMAKRAYDEARLMFSTYTFAEEQRQGPVKPVELTRDWSPPPPMRPGIVPDPPVLRRRYGGDPVRIQIGRRVFKRRLFIGSLLEQGNHRPSVDAVLNLGEEPSRWVPPGNQVSRPGDRWAEKGEGKSGMDFHEIQTEATWVLDRLRDGHSVLVHCAAGFNRSVTVAIAALILQEGLSAEAAFDRLSERHPWARPDPGHWLQLKWLSKISGVSADPGRVR